MLTSGSAAWVLGNWRIAGSQYYFSGYRKARAVSVVPTQEEVERFGMHTCSEATRRRGPWPFFMERTRLVGHKPQFRGGAIRDFQRLNGRTVNQMPPLNGTRGVAFLTAAGKR